MSNVIPAVYLALSYCDPSVASVIPILTRSVCPDLSLPLSDPCFLMLASLPLSDPWLRTLAQAFLAHM